jgi:uncharacterized membrane protein
MTPEDSMEKPLPVSDDKVPEQLGDPTRRGSIEIQSVQFSGPLPPPEILAQYDAVNPGTSAILIEMVRAQSQHRMKMEEVVITSNSNA